MSARQPLSVCLDEVEEAMDLLESESYAQGLRAASSRHPELEIADERAFRREQLRSAVLRLIPVPSPKEPRMSEEQERLTDVQIMKTVEQFPWLKHNAPFMAVVVPFARAIVALASLPDSAGEAGPDECAVPPFGWRCTRTKGHEGPCAAIEDAEGPASVERGMKRLRDAGYFTPDVLCPVCASVAGQPCTDFMGKIRPEPHAERRKVTEPDAPHPVGSALTVKDWQKRAVEVGFEYWRASDSHGVECKAAQAVELLQELLGVEVEITNVAPPKCSTCDDNGMIGGPSFYAPDEGGVPCPDCTPPAPAVKGYHPGVSGEWERRNLIGSYFSGERDVEAALHLLDEFERFHVAAPSHPPATAGKQYCDLCGGDGGHREGCRAPNVPWPATGPAVAVQAEPVALRDFEEWLNANRMQDVSSIFHDVVAHYAAALAAHPKPAAATAGFVLVPTVPNAAMNRVMEAEDWEWSEVLAAAGTATEAEIYAPATAEDAAKLPVGIAKPLRDILDDLPITKAMKSNAFEAILALRSGASAQPAEGGAA